MLEISSVEAEREGATELEERLVGWLDRGSPSIPREFKDPQFFYELDRDLEGFTKLVNLKAFNNIFHRHNSSMQWLVVITALDLETSF